MINIRKKRITFNLTAVCILLFFASTGFSSGMSADRLIPKGKVTLYQGDQKVGEVSSESPLPENTFLSVQGQCGVKMKDLYLVAVDKSLFSVSSVADARQLAVKRGTVYFAAPDASNALVFQTPGNVITTHEMVLNASSGNGLLQGYISVTDDAVKLGVLEGGSMVVSVDNDDPVRIKAGQELTLAQAELPGGAAASSGAAASTGAAASAGTIAGISTTAIVVGTGTVAAFGFAVSEAADSNNNAASPSSP